MAFTAEILNVRPESDRHRVTFHFVDGAAVRGPFVQDRPVATNAEHLAWVNGIVPVDVDEGQLLATALAGNGDPVAFRDALVSEGVEALVMDGSRFVRITGTKTSPRTIFAALQTRLGATATNRIRNKLKAAGYETMHVLGEVEKVTL